MADKSNQKLNEDNNKVTPSWRIGGPLTPAQRKAAKALFIDSLEEEGNVSVACEHAGIARVTAYKWLKTDKKFADAWEDALKGSDDVIRGAIFQRAVRGVDSYVTSQGKIVYIESDEVDGNGKKVLKPLIEKKYSDSLLSLLAKSRMEEFRDKQKLEHTGKDGEAIEVKRNLDLASLTDEELDKLHELLLKASERRDNGAVSL